MATAERLTVARSPECVVHLGVDGDIRRLAGDIEVACMDIDALALQTVVERQGLMDLAGDMQPHMAVDAAVVGIEVVPVPFDTTRRSLGWRRKKRVPCSGWCCPP